MFWDKISGLYDLFENVYNKKVYKALGTSIAAYVGKDDVVLECACGTGAISKAVAVKCKKLVAVDLSKGMLKQAKKNCSGLDNIIFKLADITKLRCRDEVFDKVIAGNVIHLLDEPVCAVKEMLRVCKTGGKVIIPTYITKSKHSIRLLVKAFDLFGGNFKRQFDLASYKDFFFGSGFENTRFFVIDGRIPCAVAVITKS